MFSHTVTKSVATPSGTIEQKKSYSASGNLEISEQIADSQVDYLIVGAIDVSAVKSLYLCSDQAITVETNATDHSGGNILVLAAGVPYEWNTDSYDTFKFTADITKFYITNASGAPANLELRVIQDATP